MKKTKLYLMITMCVALAFGLFVLTGCGGSEEPAEQEETTAAEVTESEVQTFAEADVPEEVSALVDEAKSNVEKSAEELTPDFGDQYVALIESGEAREYKDYAAMADQLKKIQVETGATYVYTLSPAKDGEPSLDGDTTDKGSFLITIDPADDPDEWGLDYEWEKQFEEAWNGETAAARSAWDDDGPLCWSVFAPIKDSNGNVVCLLGMDVPADEIKDFPAWNRDSEEWNGITE